MAVALQKPPRLVHLLNTPTVTPREGILLQNRHDKELLLLLTQGRLSYSDFKTYRSERLAGQWQWGTESFNIRASCCPCRNDCSYCYIKAMEKRFGRNNGEPPPATMICDPRHVNKVWHLVAYPMRQMYFFPSSSDIFPEMAREYAFVVQKIIAAGHQVFFTTKPTIQSITGILNEWHLSPMLDVIKANLFVYITIGTDNDTILRWFEPKSSLFSERIECAKMLVAAGFNVNFMMEPYLADPLPLITKLQPLLSPTGVIAIGQMNYGPNLTFSDIHLEDSRIRLYLQDLYSPTNVIALWSAIATNPRVFLKKDSMMAVVKAYGFRR